MHLANLKADLIGLVVLAVLAILAAVATPAGQTPIGMWPFVYGGWAALAEFTWRHPKAPRTPGKWLLYAFYSVVAAALWFGLSLIGREIFFGVDEPGISKTYDLVLLLILSPGFTFISIAGSARAIVTSKAIQSG